MYLGVDLFLKRVKMDKIRFCPVCRVKIEKQGISSYICTACNRVFYIQIGAVMENELLQKAQDAAHTPVAFIR